jgi:general secretion pathway protein F
MPRFQYRALDASGRRLGGVLSGPSEETVLAELTQRELVPVQIVEKRERAALRRRGVSARKLSEVYIELADMLEAGVPVLRALRVLAGQRNQRVASVFREVASAVADGEELAEAMSRRPDVFRPTHVAIIRAGEKGGFLEEAVSRLGRFVETQAELRSKLTGSMIYPLVLVGMGAVILLVIFAALIPRVRPMFDRIDQLPGITEFVFLVANIAANYTPAVLLVVAVAGGAFVAVRRKPAVQLFVDRMLLKLPAVGPLVRSIAVARFARMLGTMLGNGVPMLAALETARTAAGNLVLEEAISVASEEVGAGESLAASLGKSGLFSDDVIEMLGVGEEAGNLDRVLIRIADTVEVRVERLLSNVIKLVEPLLIASIAVVVFVIAVALILPLTQLSNIQ